MKTPYGNPHKILGFIFLPNRSINFFFGIFTPDKETLITQGKLYANECKPIEIDVYNGFFKSNTNKIDCHGVLIDIEKSKYDSAIEMYERSKKTNIATK